MKILIAEDDPVSRRLLETLLGKLGHIPISYEDGEQAWEALQKPGAPRMALLDWMMPGMEGTEICRQLRQLPHGELMYLILVTAKGQVDDIVTGLDAGANDYITKPPQLPELRARIQVGERVLALQDQLVRAEQDRVLVQTAGAAAHEINQPLTVLIGTAELLRYQVPEDNPIRRHIVDLNKAAERISGIVKKMSTAKRYSTQPYIKGVEIVDFDSASDDGSG